MHLVDVDTVEQMLVVAMDEVPELFTAAMHNVVVVLEDHPPPGEDLLGLFEGVPLTERNPFDEHGGLPDTITLYRVPLCETATDLADLAEWVRSTFFHELGHYLGLDEDRLHELGWG
jgi:predicted Zn-dependent protease with MMP-like domain